MRGRSPTRGFGLLETTLARVRAQKADSLIPNELRGGTIVDIGCGSPPLFLESTPFACKVGIDTRIKPGADPMTGIRLMRWNANDTDPLPLPDASVDVVTMLAVIEHVHEARLDHLLSEIKRVLGTGGICIITTPDPIAAPVLRAMAWTGLVSREEIGEHQLLVDIALHASRMKRAGFSMDGIRHGRFEWGLNSWLTARV